jgi:hypothetical protein
MNSIRYNYFWLIIFGFITLSLFAACSREKSETVAEKQSLESLDSKQSLKEENYINQPAEGNKQHDVQVAKTPIGIEYMPANKIFELAYQNAGVFIFEGTVGKIVKDGDPGIRTKIYKLWSAFASEFGNKPISGATSEVLAGQLLPAEIAKLSKSNPNFRELLISGKAPFLSGNEEMYSAAGLYSSGVLAGSFAGDGITTLLSQRANQLPPSSLDLVVYFSIGDGIREIGSGISRSYPTLESLAPYATAHNPIYRLLALQATAKALPSGVTQPPIEEGHESAMINQARVAVMRKYANETDPLIVGKLIEVLSASSNKEALDTLKLIRERQAKLGANDVVQQADQAMAQMDKIIKAKFTNP